MSNLVIFQQSPGDQTQPSLVRRSDTTPKETRHNSVDTTNKGVNDYAKSYPSTS